jgi:hypothetical protein
MILRSRASQSFIVKGSAQVHARVQQDLAAVRADYERRMKTSEKSAPPK